MTMKWFYIVVAAVCAVKYAYEYVMFGIHDLEYLVVFLFCVLMYKISKK